MIFEEVALHNFGPYRGQHKVPLEVTPQKPVIVIGALNGSGKTTLLDAMQLALYGKNARCSGRERVSYVDYLETMINRDTPLNQGAGVEFAFRSRTNGVESKIRVCRTWKKNGGSIREHLEVFRDGQPDSVASERWAEFVEDFMPSQIADLFFFDGEKIEALADPQRSAALLKVGIHSLLGLDLVESLVKSLGQLEKKKSTSAVSQVDRDALNILESEKEAEQGRFAQLRQRRTSMQNDLDRSNLREKSAVDKFKRLGGDLFDRRDQLGNELKRLIDKRLLLENQLRDLAAGGLPLMIPNTVISQAVTKAKEVRRALGSKGQKESAIQRDAGIIAFLRSISVEQNALRMTQEFLRKDLEERFVESHTKPIVPERILDQYLPDEIAWASATAGAVLTDLEDTLERLDAVERNLGAVPPQSDVAEAQADIERSRDERVRLEAVAALLDEDIAISSNRIEKHIQKIDRESHRLGEQMMDDEVSRRVILHSARARETLAKFRIRLLQENLQRLEKTILCFFQSLIRKGKLVHGVQIDPKSFEIFVIHSSGQTVPAHRLSAGERQLLAVATLWALAHASGRHLPAVIDTPLSRLDSKHRGTLVKNYFPVASHQVILLSTDEEVVGRYRKMLDPYICREYLIEHDEAASTSKISEGYFVDLAEHEAEAA